MFTIKVAKVAGTEPILELKTEWRKLLKPTVSLLRENELFCEVTEEVKPRLVKIHGID